MKKINQFITIISLGLSVSFSGAILLSSPSRAITAADACATYTMPSLNNACKEGFNNPGMNCDIKYIPTQQGPGAGGDQNTACKDGKTAKNNNTTAPNSVNNPSQAQNTAPTGVAGVGNSGSKQCGGVKTALIDCDEKGGGNVEQSGIIGVLKLIIRVMAVGVGLVAVGGIGWGAVKYASAQDNSSQLQEAITIIRNVIIGVVAFIAMAAFLNFIIPGGVL